MEMWVRYHMTEQIGKWLNTSQWPIPVKSAGISERPPPQKKKKKKYLFSYKFMFDF